jgi:hypothetical protein
VTAGRAVLVAAACLALGGCGEDDLASFREDQLAPLERRIDAERAKLSARLRTVQSGSAEDAGALREDLAGLVAAAREAAALDAPAEAADEQQAYAKAAADLARRLRSFAQALEDGGAEALHRAAARTRRALGALQQARIELDQATD